MQQYNNFTQVYVAYANKVISEFVAQGKPEKILREKIEIQILGVIDQMDFPTEFRLAYFSMVSIYVLAALFPIEKIHANRRQTKDRSY